MKIFIMIVALLTIAYLPLRRYVAPALRREVGWPFYFGAVSIIFVAQFTPYSIILLLWCAIVPNLAVTTRVGVACRYVLLVPLVPSMNPSVVLGGHAIGIFALVDMIGLGSIVATFRTAGRSSDKDRRASFAAEDWFVLTLFLIFSVGSARFDSISLLLRTLLNQSIVLLLPYWILQRNVRTRSELQLIVACIAFVGAMICMIALYETRSGWALFDGIQGRFAGEDYIAKSATVRGGLLRASATLSNAIECGFFMMLAFLATISARPYFRSPVIWLGTAALLLLGMLASQSRGALLGLFAGVLIMLVARRKFFWSFITMLLGGAGAAGLFALSGSVGRVAAFLGNHPAQGRAMDYRSLLLARGMEEGRKYPIFGTSMASVLERLKDLRQGEGIVDLVNTYLNVFLISGLVGLTALVVTILLIYRDLFSVVIHSNNRKVQLEGAYFASAFTALLASLATASFFGRMPWFTVFIAFSAKLLAQSLPRKQTYRVRERLQPIYAPAKPIEAPA